MVRRNSSIILVLLLVDLASTIFLGVYFSRRTANRQPAIQILNELKRERDEVDRQRNVNTNMISIISLTTAREIHLQNKVKQLEEQVIECDKRIQELEALIKIAKT